MAGRCRATPGRLDARRPAFTLVEMLVVLSAAALLTVLVAGACEAVRDEADKALCAARLKGLHLVLRAYADRFDGLLPDTGAASDLAGPLPDDRCHFPDRWDCRGTAMWPDERRTGNTGNLYLLIRIGLATPKDFICPASGDRPAFGPFTRERFGFLAFEPGSLFLTDQEKTFLRSNTTRHCSYSFQNMLGHPRSDWAVADPAAARVHIDQSPHDLVILADHNPYTQLQGEDRPYLDPDSHPLANSLNHAGRGQNVLYLDGCVTWQTTPECGARLDDGGRDNIYRPAEGSPLDPRNIPRHVRDSYLVP